MKREEYIEKLIFTAQEILNRTKDPIVGCREINSLLSEIDPENSIRIGFLSIASQSDLFPRGEDRLVYSEEYLNKLDKKCREFLDAMMPGILEDCRELIEYFSTNS